jgi:outer membrane protein OmpA-like peptidoglycan-associated protein
MSLLTDLVSTLDNRSLRGIATAVGEPEQSVAQGMQSAIGTVLGGMANKAQNPDALQGLLNLLPAGARDLSWSNLASSVTDPGSSLASAGKRMLSTLFGGSESAVKGALGTETGLSPTVTSSLLTMAAPMVMGFLGRRVRDEGLSMAGLGGLLQREIPAIRNVLPASLTHLLWDREERTTTTTVEPVVAQSVVKERSSTGWILPLILLALIPSFLWLFHHARRPMTTVVVVPRSGIANRVVPTTAPLPAKINLYFDTGSSTLRPDSQAKLNEFAHALAPSQDARVTVNGYTDNVGNAHSNLQLSQQRANAVVGDLEGKGISTSRVTSQGYGEEQPIADNGTAEGRAQNRRVTVEATGH